MGSVSSQRVIGEPATRLVPIVVTAKLAGGIVFNHPVMLDGLLAKVYAVRERLIVPRSAAEVVKIQVPLQRSACDRYWMCSQGQSEVELHELRHKIRRPITTHFARLCPKKRTVKISGGVDKAYRVPYSLKLLKNDSLIWYATGDPDLVRVLLREMFYLGKHTGTGKGKVSSWSVDQVDPWGEGFPVIRDGVPLRPLPDDYDGQVTQPRYEFRCLKPPYWMKENERVCIV